jgi:hypothetical protein
VFIRSIALESIRSIGLDGASVGTSTSAVSVITIKRESRDIKIAVEFGDIQSDRVILWQPLTYSSITNAPM